MNFHNPRRRRPPTPEERATFECKVDHSGGPDACVEYTAGTCHAYLVAPLFEPDAPEVTRVSGALPGEHWTDCVERRLDEMRRYPAMRYDT